MAAGKYLDPETAVQWQIREEKRRKLRRRDRVKTAALLLGGNLLLGAMLQRGLVQPVCGGVIMALYSARLGRRLGRKEP